MAPLSNNIGEDMNKTKVEIDGKGLDVNDPKQCSDFVDYYLGTTNDHVKPFMGHFEEKLFEAYVRADLSNRSRIVKAFPEIITKWAKWLYPVIKKRNQDRDNGKVF